MVRNANVFPLSSFLLLLLLLLWLYSHSYTRGGSGGYKFDDHRRTGETGRWYVPRIFQTSFNNFAVNSGRRAARDGAADESAKNERKERNTETLARAYTLEMVCSRSCPNPPFLLPPQSPGHLANEFFIGN